MSEIEGVLRLQFFFDVGDEIQLDLLPGKPAREPFPRQTPDYVRFEKPPVEEAIGKIDGLPARIRYFEYGVAAIELEHAFTCNWSELVELAAKWVGAAAPEAAAEQAMRAQIDRVGGAIRKPAAKPLTEDYTVIEIRKAQGTAAELLARHGAEIAQAVRGERLPLSDSERAEVLASSISYSQRDLLVVGYAAALVYDEQPLPTLQLLEYANTQLLEFRHYDEVLTRVLAGTQKRFGSHWRSGREANRLNALRLEIIDLSERADNSIKFLSDMFYARAYKMAAARIGVPDYRRLVDAKLQTAGEMYRFLMDEYHQGRAFILELMVVIILIIELGALFLGKR